MRTTQLRRSSAGGEQQAGSGGEQDLADVGPRRPSRQAARHGEGETGGQEREQQAAAIEQSRELPLQESGERDGEPRRGTAAAFVETSGSRKLSAVKAAKSPAAAAARTSVDDGSVRRDRVVPLTEPAERPPEGGLEPLLVERGVDVGRDEHVGARRELGDLAGLVGHLASQRHAWRR
jgi:hypothetical protein